MFQEDYEFFMPDCCAKNHWIAKQKTQKKKETQTNNHESDTFLKTSRVLRRGHFPALCFFLFPESAVKNFRAAPKTEKEIKEGRDVLGMEFAKMYFFWWHGFSLSFLLFFLNHPIIPFLPSLF